MKFKVMLSMLLAIPVLAIAQPSPITPGHTLAAGQPPAAVSVPAPTATPNSAQAPVVTCGKPTFDFGDQEEGPDITHEFVIRNRGKGPLRISGVSTSCGCTAAVVKKQGTKDEAATMPVEIPPMGKGTVKVTYHTSGRPGHAEKVITISSNDPKTPQYQLKITMTVVREVDTLPDRVYFYGIKKGEPHDSSVKVLGKAGNDLTVLSAESTNKVVTVEMTPYAEATPGTERNGAMLKITVPTTLPIGSFTDDILVKTDDPKKPELHIPIMGEVVGRVQWNPKSLYFSAGQEQPVTISLTVNPPKGFAIRRVESAKHLCKPYIHRIPGQDGNDQYQLIVSVIKNIPKASDGKDQVLVYTNDTDQPQFTVDVQASH